MGTMPALMVPKRHTIGPTVCEMGKVSASTVPKPEYVCLTIGSNKGWLG